MSQQIDSLFANGAMHSGLATAAYANFTIGMQREDLIAQLKDNADMTESQATAFADTYRVVDQYNSPLTGASATVFEDIATGQRHLAIRGTEVWDFRDLAADALIALGLTSLNPQYLAIKSQVEEWIGNGTLTQFEVTGHSSGGLYSTIIKQDFLENVTSAYAYLAPGNGGLLGDVAEFFGASLTPDAETNIFVTGMSSFSPISNLGLELGAATVIYVPTANNWSHTSINIYNGLCDLVNGTNTGPLIRSNGSDGSIRLETLHKDGGSSISIYYADNSIRNETYDENGTLIWSNYIPASTPATNTFTLTNNPDLATEQTEVTDPTSAVSEDNSTLIDNGIYQVLGLGNVNTITGNQQAANATLSDNWMPGANQVLDSDLWANVKENYLDQTAYDYSGAYANQQATGATQWTPVDPLILDLNGDGVKLTSFAEAPVLFDIDNDGGSKEITGWVSGEDGIVVMDLNGNGLIDGIHETMSEYFNGTVGSDGEAGSKPYSDGFAALKSLDSNGDNLFTSADTAWSSVKVWQDANHDGITDAGELKSFAELNITSINLNPTSQSGLINGGNEVLATGSFVQNGQSKEAQAARFIANPTGNSVTLIASGATVSAQDGQSTYVSSVTTGEVIDVAAKGVKNAYGNSGDDILTSDAEANWLVGGQGSDTFYAGAGDDMLIVDAADPDWRMAA